MSVLRFPVWRVAANVFNKQSRTADNRLRLKCDGTRAEIRFRLSAKGTSPFKLAGASVHLTTGSRVCASAVVMVDTPCFEVV
jgi:hypothetical protein